MKSDVELLDRVYCDTHLRLSVWLSVNQISQKVFSQSTSVWWVPSPTDPDMKWLDFEGNRPGDPE